MTFQGKPAILEIFHDITQRKLAEEEVRKHLSELEVVYSSSLAINQTLKPKEIGKKVLSLLIDRFAWHHAAVTQFHEETNTYELLAFQQPGLENENEQQIAEISL